MNEEITRKKHVIWTVSGRYKSKPRSILFDENSLDELTELRLVVIGGIYRYIPQEYIDDYLLRIVGLGESTKYFLEVFFCLSQEYVMDRLSRHRHLLPYIERVNVNEIFRHIKSMPIKSERDKLRYTYFAYKSGNNYSKFDVDMQIINTIKSVKNIGNAYEFMKLLYTIFEMYLGGIPNKYISKNSLDQHDEYKLRSEVLKKAESNIFDDDHEDAEVFAAEFNHNVMEEEVEQQLEAVDDTLLFSSHADSKVMFDKILSNYGPSKFSDRQRVELEKVLSKDNHRGCKIHYTSEFMSKSKGYKKEYMQEQYDANYRFFLENQALYEANIKNLVAIIREKILTDLEETYFNLDRGVINRNKIYRYPILKDNKVFMKKVKEEVGSIAVTILIDSSGSQLARQKQVAAWAYVLAQSFLICNIPTRVVGFNNLFDYTVFREFRDFNDGLGKNKDVFYFVAEGSNRDGMAISTASYLMRFKNESKRLLIVLSDGKPNDVRIGIASHMVSGHDTSEYTGLLAVEDTARIVRKCRAQGVSIVGIYTGERDDIATQKLIYGKDFAYVPDLSQLAKIVGKAIEIVIHNESTVE